MLRLNASFGENSTSNHFISNHSEPINIAAVGTWDSNTLTVEFNPDPKREASWSTLYQDGSAVVLSATDNVKALVLAGGFYLRLVSGAGASTDLNLWVGGPGVTLVSGEV